MYQPPGQVPFIPLEGAIRQAIAPVACSTCHRIPGQREPPLGLCPHCARVGYCSRQCQRWHWNFHRPSCPILRAEPLQLIYEPVAIVNEPLLQPSYNNSLRCYMPRPFTRLFFHIWLHDRPKEDVLRLLIDAFRVYVTCQNSPTHCMTPDLYRDAMNPLTGFRNFMTAITRKPWLLPSWWHPNDLQEVEQIGLDMSDFNW